MPTLDELEQKKQNKNTLDNLGGKLNMGRAFSAGILASSQTQQQRPGPGSLVDIGGGFMQAAPAPQPQSQTGDKLSNFISGFTGDLLSQKKEQSKIAEAKTLLDKKGKFDISKEIFKQDRTDARVNKQIKSNEKIAANKLKQGLTANEAEVIQKVASSFGKRLDPETKLPSDLSKSEQERILAIYRDEIKAGVNHEEAIENVRTTMIRGKRPNSPALPDTPASFLETVKPFFQKLNQ